ncbi:hypothetical protein [Sphingobium sp.]|uniref:hypothetical protein n=1 Tax=Sphingobium sp. TaxID=1912891 RepID=UPI003BB77F61
MRQYNDGNDKASASTVRGNLMLMAFGLGVLGFLVSIDHPEWFHLRPMTGTAVAMSYASDTNQGNGF